MRRFTAKIVDMMKQEMLFASQGGPIILAQVGSQLSGQGKKKQQLTASVSPERAHISV